ncbi:autophagy protein 16 [Aaosphaeria arxii CBS 175.79]|uniref:Autophagy protein 16 n=1 Tax=Aaosphaeria arxii CBS 175.79 TaxID=1450172 RepID=A0A6A5XRC7_9PLEO|nr:autophagy protein 16 [Aaosphaeria arxii CBS 175.79]KAF2014854.1 autophagy protein 16 [Aaosphaeria arxii CBS 175.79]
MSTPSVEYLSALEARDAREQSHAHYIQIFTRFADRSAASTYPSVSSAGGSVPISSLPLRPTSSKKQSYGPLDATAPDATFSTPSSGEVTQIRAELAQTQKLRNDLETKVSDQGVELEGLRLAATEQKKRIAQLEKTKEYLEQKVKDRADELRGKGRFVEEVQDEMVAMNLQLNMAEQEKEKLRLENEELTRRWMAKMEAEAHSMNEKMDKEMEGRKGR